MEKPKQLIIVGGGRSIREGIEKGLWERLKGHFVIGTNFSFNYYVPTMLAAVDRKFYEGNQEKLKDLPLVVTRQTKNLKFTHPNTIRMETSMHYSRDLSGGVYSGVLTGIFSLSLGIYLLDAGEIFLLGMDWTKDKNKNEVAETHFYQGHINHRGIGKIDYYKNHNPNDTWKVYSGETKCKIYNVSSISEIRNFPKLTYDEFFTKLDNSVYNQIELAAEIRAKLTTTKSIRF
jgi:hypothetical protein